MFCSKCDTPLDPDAKFCTNCGLSTSNDPLPREEIAITQSTTSATVPIADTATLGTKWLKIWNYFYLPLGAFQNLFAFCHPSAPGFTEITLGILIGTLQLAVAYGLHNRKLWAWQWNWNLIFIAYGNIVIKLSQPSPGCNRAILFFVGLTLGGLFWMWPNYVYWKKRRELFFWFKALNCGLPSRGGIEPSREYRPG